MSVVVLADSTCDLTDAVARPLGIEIVPMQISFGSEQFLDGVNLSREKFYSKLASDKELPVSGPPTVQAWVDIFKKHLAAGRAIVCIAISATLSETYKNAAQAVAQIGDPRIELIDSRSLSGGVGLLAIVAAQMAQTGKTAAEIRKEIEKLRETQRGFFTLPDLAPLARSGRINKAQTMLGTVMKIIPILKVNPLTGAVEGEAQTRTFEKAKELLVEIAMRYIPKPADSRVVISHANDPALGETIAANLRAKLSAPPKYLLVTGAGPAIGVHAGPGAIAIFSAEG
ncbi:MAG: DegV family protein [Candidatus Eremiobacteraeota bacterium]|nr:DegV family protein [Candidatus Eremiobacteraeota bacterium]